MVTVKQYIFSLITIVLFCGLAQIPFTGSPIESLIKFAAGLILLIATLSPILRSNTIPINTIWNEIYIDGEAIASKGEETARLQLSENIKLSTESYICDMADSMGVDIRAEVLLDESVVPVPVTVKLFGAVSPYLKEQLCNNIENQLGISEERQIWIS